MERCRFFGGTYGIIGYYTAPGWQFYVGDCIFDGQSRACIMSSKTGLTLVRDTLRNAPWGVYVPNKELYDVPVNETERLYLEDCRAENIATAVVSMGWLRNPINWLHTTGTVLPQRADVPRSVWVSVCVLLFRTADHARIPLLPRGVPYRLQSYGAQQ